MLLQTVERPISQSAKTSKLCSKYVDQVEIARKKRKKGRKGEGERERKRGKFFTIAIHNVRHVRNKNVSSFLIYILLL